MCIHLDIIPDGDSLAKRQPHPASNICVPGQATASSGGDTEVAYAIGADGPIDLLYLSSGNPWRDISSGVGNSSAQTVDDHVLVNGRTRKRSAAGGWSEAEVCAEKLPLRWRPCMEENAAASGSCYWLGAPMRIGRGAVEDRGKRESQQAPARKATCRKGAASESNLPAGSIIGKQLPEGVIGRIA